MSFVWEASRVVGIMWLPQPRIVKNRTYSSHREHVSTPHCLLYTEVITQHLHAAIMGEVTVWKLPSIGTWRRGTLLNGTLENVPAPTAIRPFSNVSTQTRWGWNPRSMKGCISSELPLRPRHLQEQFILFIQQLLVFICLFSAGRQNTAQVGWRPIEDSGGRFKYLSINC